MKYLLDTNVLVSAILFPNGTTGRAYAAALSAPVDVVVCGCTITELRDVFAAKFPGDLSSVERFISGMAPGIDIVPTPGSIEGVDVSSVRDPEDWPIVWAAVAAGVDIIVTGDKDLLEAGLARPGMLTPALFLQLIV